MSPLSYVDTLCSRPHQNITETENWSPGSHEFLARAPNIMSDIRHVGGKNEIVCELLEYGAEKLIVKVCPKSRVSVMSSVGVQCLHLLN